MIDKDPSTCIKKELIALKAEEVRANNILHYKYQSGMGVYDLLQALERVQKRRVELELALKVLAQFK